MDSEETKSAVSDKIALLDSLVGINVINFS